MKNAIKTSEDLDTNSYRDYDREDYEKMYSKPDHPGFTKFVHKSAIACLLIAGAGSDALIYLVAALGSQLSQRAVFQIIIWSVFAVALVWFVYRVAKHLKG